MSFQFIEKIDNLRNALGGGGGVLIAVHYSLVSSQLTATEAFIHHSILDILCVEVKSNHNKLLIVGVYIPPFTPDCLYKDLVNFIDEISIDYLPENVILCGDFNLPNLRWTSNPLNYNALQYVCPKVISAVDILLHLGLLMDWHHLCLPYS